MARSRCSGASGLPCPAPRMICVREKAVVDLAVSGGRPPASSGVNQGIYGDLSLSRAGHRRSRDKIVDSPTSRSQRLTN